MTDQLYPSWQLPDALEPLWARVQQFEELGLRPQAKAALNEFLDKLLEWPDWQLWALHLARRAIDHGARLRIRHPLFQRAVRPALEEAIRQGHSAACRWLAGFAQFRDWQEQPNRTELLRLAVQRDPHDRISQLVLVE